MVFVISKSTFGAYNVRDIQCNTNWCSCPYSDYALIPDNLVDGILATNGYCDITLNSSGTEVVSFEARSIPTVPEDCCGKNTILSVNGVTANTEGELTLTPSDIGAAPGEAQAVTTADDARENGWYLAPLPERPGELGGSGNVLMRVDARDGYAVQTMYLAGGIVIRRTSDNAGWSAWEDTNPPLFPGMEYRTTERHKGKVVYVTRLLVGELTNSGVTTATLPSTPTEIVELYGTAKSDTYSETVMFPIITANGAIGARLTANGSNQIQAKTFADYTGYVATVTVKYTKD